MHRLNWKTAEPMDLYSCFFLMQLLAISVHRRLCLYYCPLLPPKPSKESVSRTAKLYRTTGIFYEPDCITTMNFSCVALLYNRICFGMVQLTKVIAKNLYSKCFYV